MKATPAAPAPVSNETVKYLHKVFHNTIAGNGLSGRLTNGMLDTELDEVLEDYFKNEKFHREQSWEVSRELDALKAQRTAVREFLGTVTL